ncbi:hypothetical protein K450DRAFT_254985 [Umbelopsis ramanniana AG]|uniref:Ras guanine nucleotide exchange factor domain-containing protein n=1 Tax=Umbelopsis ramanniana AG TaxID=1314678 RepID=A0AAD5HA66_UMBRA|nr:uncharacterized protein K450DRAFT_254985 [Umbelopsis ramanniana AG]KAI8576795.1 hypothetical protein K450DRAFT_254985 [Umbelopsis ramanniana AG]
MEMVSGKLQVVAGTAERLFIKLADETAQDMDYVDTYLLCHSYFCSPAELLENLMARFHLEATPGEADYFEKWQRTIQVKVLNVISRWLKLQYEDFQCNEILLQRLQAFLDGDIQRAGFRSEAALLRESIQLQCARHARPVHTLITVAADPLLQTDRYLHASSSPKTPLPKSSTKSSFVSRRPSGASSIFSFVSSITTPPESPTLPNVSSTSLSMFESKEIAQYLTLADFYYFKCISAFEFLNGTWRAGAQAGNTMECNSSPSHSYVLRMTKRANMLSRWVAHETLVAKGMKQRRLMMRKFIDVARLCLGWNNYHTAMVIVMGLKSNSVQKLEEAWQSMPSRDLATMRSLEKLLDVSGNMRPYRTAFSSAKAPAIPFFPIVLKDLTFFVEGNKTYLEDNSTDVASSYTSMKDTRRPSPNELSLINFAKFRTVTRFVTSMLALTSENYSFAGLLETTPFFNLTAGFGVAPDMNTSIGPLDLLAQTIERRIQIVPTSHTSS